MVLDEDAERIEVPSHQQIPGLYGNAGGVQDWVANKRQVLVLGGRARQINVWLDADQLFAQGLTVNDVSRALQAQNSDVPGEMG